MTQHTNINSELLSERDTLAEGLAYHRNGDFQSAEAIYRKVYVNNPSCADVPHLSGLILYHFGEPDSAAYSIRRAIVLDDSKPHYHYNLGVVLLEQGEIQEAKACLAKALSLNPNYQLARSMLKDIENI